MPSDDFNIRVLLDTKLFWSDSSRVDAKLQTFERRQREFLARMRDIESQATRIERLAARAYRITSRLGMTSMLTQGYSVLAIGEGLHDSFANRPAREAMESMIDAAPGIATMLGGPMIGMLTSLITDSYKWIKKQDDEIKKIESDIEEKNRDLRDQFTKQIRQDLLDFNREFEKKIEKMLADAEDRRRYQEDIDGRVRGIYEFLAAESLKAA